MIDISKMKALAAKLRRRAHPTVQGNTWVRSDNRDAATAIDSLLSELEAREADRRLTGDRLTDEKARHIMRRDGYKLTGVVLATDDGARCIVEMGAMRWLSIDQWWALTHPNDLAQRQEGEEK
ncbi:hypothetical protein KPB04_12230 [Burkholderia cenocepacia]|uniref:hypothetical protein n=1 Tax=Burkholderia cenocepacia TaxID=95486 RepID=UPI00286039DF|nr:hypothetical protein [Burkholderia cenocepacia]MDR8102495.1 hypothetical protein [Burkholderia cenocepacia]